MPDTNTVRARQAYWLLLLVAAVMPLCIARSQLLTGDPTYYLALADSIVSGTGYTVFGARHTTYPPGLPLLLTPVTALFGPNVVAAQAWIAMLAVGACVAVRAALREIAPGLALPIVALTVLSFPYFVLATSTLRAELPFLAVTAALLWLVTRERSQTTRWAVPLVVGLGSMTVMLRTIGVAMPIALLVTWAQRRVRRVTWSSTDTLLLAGGVAGILTTIAWMMWTRGSDESYSALLRLRDPHEPDLGEASIGEMLARIPNALAIQLTHVATLPIAGRWVVPTWMSPVTIGLGLCLTAGVLRGWRQRNPIVAWYVAGYVGVLLIWPFDEGARFIIPILPFLLVVLARGLATWIPALDGSALTQGAHNDDTALDPHGRRTIRRVAVGVIGVCVIASFALPHPAGLTAGTRQLALIVVAWVVVGALVGFAAVRPDRRHAHVIGCRLAWCVVAVYVVANASRTVGQARMQLSGADLDPMRLRPAISWMGAHLRPADVVLSEFPSAVSLHTGVHAAQLPPTSRTDALVNALRHSRASYILVGDPPEFPYYRPTESQRFALLQSAAGAEAFEIAYRYDGGTVYRFRSATGQ